MNVPLEFNRTKDRGCVRTTVPYHPRPFRHSVADEISSVDLDRLDFVEVSLESGSPRPGGPKADMLLACLPAGRGRGEARHPIESDV